jgi:predicted naringenin-chalcone synthase
MFIQGVGTATPAFRYSQRDCWEAYCRSPFPDRLSGRSHAILRKVLTGDCGIGHRCFVMSNLEEAYSIDPNTLHRRFAENAPALAAAAAGRALENAGVSIREIDALLISTCTGYLCPGLTSYVGERLGLNSRAYLADLVGHGCGAALPNLQLGSALLASGQARNVLSICVEICSAAFYLDNDPGVLISNCLFGDAAAAVVLSREASRRQRRVEWSAFGTVLNPRDRELLRFESRDGMLRNVLDKSVPVLVVELVREVMRDLKVENGGVDEWIIHSGGRDVLVALESGLRIPPGKLAWSSSVLREFGNVSSPSVLFAFEKALLGGGKPGTWFLSAFGAGISCHGALLEVG